MVEKKGRLLSDLLGIHYPIIVAPMFLVSSPKMVVEALKSGCTAAIPALNFRTSDALRNGIREVRKLQKGPFGINLIVNKSNLRLKKDLKICLEEEVDFYITSLGNPIDVIEEAHLRNKLVFCDVVNTEYAVKVEKLGADAVIAVNKRAGGHAGPLSMAELMAGLRQSIQIPIISAGGICGPEDVREALDAGAAGVSVGTLFIASDEAPVSGDYKRALVQYGEEDIVMTSRLSGSPCTVINTPYVKEMGLKPTFLERLMKKNKRMKKILKMILFLKGMKKLRNSALNFTYKQVWCAGPSIEKIREIRPMGVIISDLTSGLEG